jgi:hypothetical protein
MQSIVMQANNGFNPMAISPPPNLFVNPYRDAYVSSVDNNGVRQRGNIIDSATATTGQALATAGTLGSKPIYNGEGWYLEAGAQLTTGSASDYNFIHDGSNFDIWVVVFICPTTSTTYQRTIICNNGFSTTARGILLRANSTTGNNQLVCNIGNGTASFITLTANGALTVNASHIIRVTRSGSTARMFVNGSQVATQTISLSPGVGNAAGVMTIGTAIAATANLYFKDLVIFNRALTSSEAISMNTRKFAFITPKPINVYMLEGDSNSAGRALNASIASDLIGNIPGCFIETIIAAIEASSWSGRLLLGTNQTISSEFPATQHGAEMRFGKSMGAVKDTYLIKFGKGSHSAFARGGANSPDFNISSASGAYIDFTTKVLPVVLNDLVHVQRRTPIFRGLTIVLGANDAVFAATSVAWARSGTSATLTKNFHGLVAGATFGIYNSNDLSAIPDGIYTISSATTNTFTVTVPNAGATSGTASYSGAYNFKQNCYNIINGIIDYLQNTIKNQVTNGTGYTVNKLRIFIPRITDPLASLPVEAYNQSRNGQMAIGDNYLIDNPSRSVNVLGSTWQNTDGYGMLDGLHYNHLGQDALGLIMSTYYLPFRDE